MIKVTAYLKRRYWWLIEKKKLFEKRTNTHITNHLPVNKIGMWYCQEICKREYNSQEFVEINERPIEYSFVFQALARTSPKTVLDVGTGTTALPHLMKTAGFIVNSVDNIYDYWPRGMFNRHFYVINDDITNTKILYKFDFITCVSVLEHIPNYNSAIKSMFSLLNPGGYIALTFPYNEANYIENVYKLPEAGYGQNASYICQVFSRNELNNWLNTNNGKIVEQEYWQVFSGDFWTFGKRLCPPQQVGKHKKHQLTCVLIEKH